MVGWLGGWLENWRVMPISAFNYVIVEVVAEIGKKNNDMINNSRAKKLQISMNLEANYQEFSI